MKFGNHGGKKKKPEVAGDDVIRKFFAFHAKQVIEEMQVSDVSSADMAQLIEMAIEHVGDGIEDMVQGSIALTIQAIAGEDDDG